MSHGNVDTFGLSDITVKDLVLDDLAGYVDLLKEMDENIIDRQASIVLYEVYKEEFDIQSPSDMPLIVKRWIAGHTALRLIISLRTWIARYERRGDTSQTGAVTSYDQLAALDDVELALKYRLNDIRNEVQLALKDVFTLGGPSYDRPGISDSTARNELFATLDPWRIGKKMFEN